MSTVLRPDRTLKEGLLITTAAATAQSAGSEEKICGSTLGSNGSMIWYFLRNKKVCGILTEAVTDFESGNIEFAVVGIGLNLYMLEDGFPGRYTGNGLIFENRNDAGI